MTLFGAYRWYGSGQAAVAEVALSLDVDASLAEKLEAARKHLGIPGLVVGIYARNETLGEYALGVADVSTGEAMTTEHAFRIGSLTKPIVATAALTMVDDGSLTLDEPVSRWFGPGLPSIEGGEPITLAQLLSHRSGLVEYLRLPGVKERYASDPQRRRAPESLLLEVFRLGEPFAFGPGETHGYSNTNYVLAGRALELVSGRSLGDLLDERVFGPLGLENTRYTLDLAMPEQAARGYQTGDADGPVWWRPRGETLHDVTEASPTIWHGAGAVVSTLGDIRRLMQAIIDGELLTPATHRAQFEGLGADEEATYDADAGSVYGLGLERWRGSIVGHAGQVAGYHVRAGVLTDHDDVLVVVLTNLYGNEATRSPADAVFGVVREHVVQSNGVR